MKEAQRDLNDPGGDIQPNTTLGGFVVRYPQLRHCLEQMGIDYCCGGKKSLGEAAELAGVQWPTVLASLKEALASVQKSSAHTDWNNVPLSLLVDHILDTHHAFLKEQMPRLDGLLTKVEKAHAERHAEMLGHLGRAYRALRAELEPHLMKEEQILFPAIKGIDAFMSGKGAKPLGQCAGIVNPIRQMEHEHDSAGNLLAEMRRITDGYQLPADACQTFTALYDGMRAMEADLHEHIHLENNILFPKSIVREDEMLHKKA